MCSVLRPYYFNAVTQSSQWTFPTVAAAVPLPAMPTLHQPGTRHASPGTIGAMGNEFGGVGDMAATLSLHSSSKGAPPPTRSPLGKGRTDASKDAEWF